MTAWLMPGDMIAGYDTVEARGLHRRPAAYHYRCDRCDFEYIVPADAPFLSASTVADLDGHRRTHLPTEGAAVSNDNPNQAASTTDGINFTVDGSQDFPEWMLGALQRRGEKLIDAALTEERAATDRPHQRRVPGHCQAC